MEQSGNPYKLQDNSKTLHNQHEFQEEKRKKRSERKCCRRQIVSRTTLCATKRERGCHFPFNDMAEGGFWPIGGLHELTTFSIK